MKRLTTRQQQILDYIRERVSVERVPPTLREIGRHFGFRSVKAASDHLYSLEQKGFLKTTSHVARALQVIEPLDPLRQVVLEIPIFGTIPAGPPELCLQEAEGCLSADVAALGVTPSARVFALRVPDDALESLHVCAGDVLVFEHARVAREGDIVAVLLNGRSALRIHGWAGRQAVLTLPDPGEAPVPADEVVIQGVMVSLVRSV